MILGMSETTVLNRNKNNQFNARTSHGIEKGAINSIGEKPLLTRGEVAFLLGFKSTKSIWRY